MPEAGLDHADQRAEQMGGSPLVTGPQRARQVPFDQRLDRVPVPILFEPLETSTS